ncbi:MAG: DUF924 domain-containing protein [Rhodobacteraceae bacterium]|nr:DUF924 domain-containing protein [Paracoccaceae bacterium]
MPLPARADEILRYWTDLGPEGWYAGGEALDAEIRGRFLDTWTEAARGAHLGWQSCPEGMLAYLVLTDQFPRNMFRGEARAFATDARARAVASRAWQHKIDLEIDEPLRQFFYMPFMHAESLFDQDRCVCLMVARLSGGPASALHARAHREIIRRFRRFPYRNAALGRETTPAEAEFLAAGGYADILRTLQT